MKRGGSIVGDRGTYFSFSFSLFFLINKVRFNQTMAKSFVNLRIPSEVFDEINKLNKGQQLVPYKGQSRKTSANQIVLATLAALGLGGVGYTKL